MPEVISIVVGSTKLPLTVDSDGQPLKLDHLSSDHDSVAILIAYKPCLSDQEIHFNPQSTFIVH